MTTDTASSRIRASINALPGSALHLVVDSPDGTEAAIAEHVLMLASPDVAAALANLLDALQRWDWVGSDTSMDKHLGATRGLREAYRALEAAILRERP